MVEKLARQGGAGGGESSPGGLTQGLMAEARRGNAQARETLLRRYQPFVLRVAGQVTRRRVDPARDDEFSVGLAAFNEAIDHYDDDRGGSFFAFAEQVIRRRLVDHYRKERTARREVPWSSVDDPVQGPSCLPEVREAVLAHRAETEAGERREEVLRYRELLRHYGVRLPDLVRAGPRHADTRRSALRAARTLAEDPVLAAALRQRRVVPMRLLAERSGMKRKTLERHRRYILAAALILLEDLPYLKSYLLRE